MTGDRKARRRAALVARKAATKARLAEPPTRPKVPVALAWERRPRPVRRAKAYADGFSTIVSGDVNDLEGSRDSIADFVESLGPLFGGRTR